MKLHVETIENPAKDIQAVSDLEDDPHRAALELNPEKPERLTWSTTLAVGVSISRIVYPSGLTVAIGTRSFICGSPIARLPSPYSYSRPARYGSR